MSKLTIVVTLASLIIIASMLGAQVDDNPPQPLGPISPRTGLLLKDSVTIKLINTSSGDLAHDYVSRIALWDRTRMTRGFREAAEWVAQKAEEFGLEEDEVNEEFCECLNEEQIECEPLGLDQFSAVVRVPQADPLFRSRVSRETKSLIEEVSGGS